MAYVQQNLFGSHDANRLASHIVNRDFARYGDWGDYFGKSKSDNPDYDTRKPTEAEYAIQKLFAVFQMTYVGAPMVYYGDEVGMWGANDPDCRKPMVWGEFTYEPEQVRADGSRYNEPQSVEVHEELLAHYQRLIALRNAEPLLQSGAFTTLLVDDQKEIYAFRRHLTGQDKGIVVVLNNSATSQQITLKAAWGETLYCSRAVEEIKADEVLIPAKGFAIFREE